MTEFNIIIRILGKDLCDLDKLNGFVDDELVDNVVYRSQYAILLAQGDVKTFLEAYKCPIHNIWAFDYIVRDVLSNAPIEGYLEGIYKTFHIEKGDYTTFAINSIAKLENGVVFTITDHNNNITCTIEVRDNSNRLDAELL